MPNFCIEDPKLYALEKMMKQIPRGYITQNHMNNKAVAKDVGSQAGSHQPTADNSCLL